MYVDDIKITGSDPSGIKYLRTELQKAYNIKDITQESGTYLGSTSNPIAGGGLHITQTHYVSKILRDFGMQDCNPVNSLGTVMLTARTDGQASLEEQQLYASATGSLQWLTTQTRPDTAFRINSCSRYNKNPGKQHWEAVKQIFRYLKGHPDRGPTFKVQPNGLTIKAFSDSDFAGCADTRSSTTGLIIFISGGPVIWRSRLQSTVVLSTTEAEYNALTETVREINWLQNLLTELGFPLHQVSPISVFEDNQSTIQLATNHANHKRSKHVDLRNHYCREQAQMGRITVEKVASEAQAADGLTKPLPGPAFNRFINMIGMV